MRTFVFGAAAAVAVVLGASSAQAATVLSVNWNSDCGKSTCFNDNGSYTQTFSANSFDGPVNISQLLMDRGVLGALDSKTFRLSFQLNGETLGTWGQYNMGGIGGDQLWFGGESFVWNPEDGDLQLVLTIVPPPKEGAGGGGGFASNSFELLPETDSNDVGEPGGGDQPGQRPTAAVPEPATWAMMIAGFGLAGSMMRRRRAVVLLQP